MYAEWLARAKSLPESCLVKGEQFPFAVKQPGEYAKYATWEVTAGPVSMVVKLINGMKLKENTLAFKMKLEDGSAGPVVSFTFQTKDEAQLVHDFVKDLINQMRADKKAAKEKAQGE